MAFDSNSSFRLSSPSLQASLNDWTLQANLQSLVFESTLNNMQAICSAPLPIVEFSAFIVSGFDVAAVLPSPVFRSASERAVTRTLNYTFPLPRISCTIDVPQTYTLDYVFSRPTTTAGFSEQIGFSLTSRLHLPQLSATAHFLSGISDIWSNEETSPGSSQTQKTWVLNTITTAHTRYENYSFNSFFVVGPRVYGLATNGIYELTGDRDFSGEEGLEAQINAGIDLPITDFGEQNSKACSDAILYGRCNGEMELRLVVDEQEERTGFIFNYDNKNGMHRKRIQIPQGIKGNTWQFKLRNVNGSDFDINAYEVYARELKRLR